MASLVASSVARMAGVDEAERERVSEHVRLLLGASRELVDQLEVLSSFLRWSEQSLSPEPLSTTALIDLLDQALLRQGEPPRVTLEATTSTHADLQSDDEEGKPVRFPRVDVDTWGVRQIVEDLVDGIRSSAVAVHYEHDTIPLKVDIQAHGRLVDISFAIPTAAMPNQQARTDALLRRGLGRTISVTGFATAAMIARRSGGDLTAEGPDDPRAPGGETTIRLTLPASARTSPPSSAHTDGARPG